MLIELLFLSAVTTASDVYSRASEADARQEAYRAEYSLHEHVDRQAVSKVLRKSESFDFDIVRSSDGQQVVHVSSNGGTTGALDGVAGSASIGPELSVWGRMSGPQNEWFDLARMSATRLVREEVLDGHLTWVLELEPIDRQTNTGAGSPRTRHHELVWIDQEDSAIVRRQITFDMPAKTRRQVDLRYAKAQGDTVWLLTAAEIRTTIRNPFGGLIIAEKHSFSQYKKFTSDSAVHFPETQ